MLRRIYRLLLPSERKTGLRVVGAVFLNSVLDFAGLAALFPVLFFLLEEGDGNRSDRRVALLFCLGALVFILLKNALVTALSRFQNRFLLSLYRRLSLSLFRTYYHRGLLFIRHKGTICSSYEINYICYAFSFNILSPLLRMAGDVLLVVLVTLALLVYAPLTVLMLYIAFVPFIFIYGRVVRKRMRRYGEEEQLVRRGQSGLVAETLEGYAELELNAAFPVMERSFVEGLQKISNCRLKLETMQHGPLCLSELAVITGLTLFTAFGVGEIKALIGVFTVASFRLLPALRYLLSGWTQIQNSLCCLHVVEEGTKEEPEMPLPPRPLSFHQEITIERLSFRYPDGQEVLNEFSCTIRKGEYVGLCGESGIGKSTLFNLLLGFFRPTSGEIRIDGVPLTGSVKAAWHRRVGYVPQEVFIRSGTLAQNIALGCEHPDREKIKRIVRQVKLDEWAESLSLGIDTPLAECGRSLSGGQKQRVGIARALYKDADVLLLDEATSSLDDDTERVVNQVLRQLTEDCGELTILSIAHRESSLACCHRVINLNRKENG